MVDGRGPVDPAGYGQANDRVKEVQCLLNQWAADRGSSFSPKGVETGSNCQELWISSGSP